MLAESCGVIRVKHSAYLVQFHTGPVLDLEYYLLGYY